MIRKDVQPKTFFFFIAIAILVRFLLLPALAGTALEAQNTPSPVTITYDPYAHVHIQAAAAYVLDTTTNTTLYEKNATAPLPLASVTKLMTTLIAYEDLPDAMTITLSPETLIATDGDAGLLPYERWQKKDLIDLTLVASANDGAVALGEALKSYTHTPASTLMNTKAKTLGLTSMHFLNPTGLDIDNETKPGAYGSAKDVAHLISYILEHYPQLLEPTRYESITRTSEDGHTHTFKNTNKVSGAIPWLVGSKTGFTDQAGGNLAVVFDVGPAHPVAVVVLGSTIDDRFTDVESLVRSTLTYFSLN